MVDIRDFFGNSGKKATPKKKAPAPAPKRSRPTTITIEDNDDDDDDDSLIELTRPKKISKTEEIPEKSKFFKEKEEVKPQSKPEPKPKPKPRAKKIIIDDDDFEVPDEDEEPDYDFDKNEDDDEEEFLQEIKAEPKERTSSRRNTTKTTTPKPESPKKAPAPKKETPKKVTKKAPAVKASTSTSTGVTAFDVLSKIEDAELPEDIPTGEGSGFNFRDFKARQSNAAPSTGTFDLPEGAPGCLTGLTIVFTGVLPNVSRDDCENIAKRYGAKVTKSISSKTSVVVLGEEAGPSKVRKIKQFKIKAINEDGFIQLIKGMPEDGGDGENAEKARLKRQEEEQKALDESIRMQEEAEEESKRRAKELEKAKKTGNIANTAKFTSDEDKLWTVRYAPTKIDQICGNKSSVQKLKTWLETWPEKFGHRKQVKGDTELRAVLIHGPPGIGKTTAAHLVANSLGYDVLEKNASDVRSKGLLNDTVGGVLNNSSVVGFFNKNKNNHENSNKFCIIMDEVDGMSGGDRGGVGQLAAFCRTTQAPLILICNDKSLPKMRPFDRVTLDIPFRRPSAKEMKSRLMTIALREHIKLDPNIIDQLVAATSNDIRQIINLLSTVSKTQKSIDSTNSKGISSEWQKNIALKPFDIIPRLLSGQLYLENTPVPLYKKMEYYFDDHAFVPLMLQENYLNTRPAKGSGKLQHLELVAKAADSISLGDIVDSKIHSSEQQWSLMPLHAIMSTVRPASFVAGNLAGRVNFSAWLGQNSKTGKYLRLLTELHYRSRLRTSTDQTELRLEYIPVLSKKLLNPLIQNGADSIPDVIAMLDNYYLTKTDWDYLMEFPIGEDSTQALLKKIPTATKSKFTRKYNSTSHPISIYRPGLTTSVSKPKKDAPDFDDVVEDDIEEDDNDD